MRSLLIALGAIAHLTACADPPCADGHRKIGTVCVRVDAGVRVETGPDERDELEDDEDADEEARGSEDAGSRTAPRATVDAMADDVPEGPAPGAGSAASSMLDGGAVEDVATGRTNSDAGKESDSGTPPVVAAKQRLAAAITGGCFILSNGAVKCWGATTASASGTAGAIDVGGVSDAVQVALNAGWGCALLSDSTVSCWAAETRMGVTIGLVVNAESIAAGANDICVVLKDGTVMCRQFSGRSFNLVAGVTNAQQIGVGAEHACALLKDGKVSCWGRNTAGQLGTDTGVDMEGEVEPTVIAGLTDIIAVTAGSDHTCAVLKDQTVKCWGSNAAGQLGGTIAERSPVPLAINGLSNVVEIAAGSTYTCARKTDQTVSCWGDMLIATWRVATPIAGLTGVKEIATGPTHACALMSDEAVLCWGDNSLGQLGQGTNSVASSTPMRVVGL